MAKPTFLFPVCNTFCNFSLTSKIFNNFWKKFPNLFQLWGKELYLQIMRLLEIWTWGTCWCRHDVIRQISFWWSGPQGNSSSKNKEILMSLQICLKGIFSREEITCNILNIQDQKVYPKRKPELHFWDCMLLFII